MPIIPITKVADIGLNKDLPNHKLPPEAWTDALNVEFEEGKAKRSLGWDPVFGTPGVAPAFALPFDNAGVPWWLYANAIGSGSQVYAYDGNTHTDISKTGNYNVSNPYDWNGVIFQGVAIINPVSDDPQYWAMASAGTDLADLTNWPADFRCRLIRSYKNFLIALRTIESASELPYRVRWSDAAVPGSLPGSWDVTDATTDAGEVDINDAQGGPILDGRQLGEDFIIYTNEGTHRLRYIGGSFIMANRQVSTTSGILTTNCVGNITQDEKDIHLIMTGTDLIAFNGQVMRSVVNRRMRKFLVSDIDANNFETSYIAVDDTNKIAYFCYPESGSSEVTKALVWDWRNNTFTFRDWPHVTAKYGSISVGSGETWTTVPGTWDAQDGSWQGETQRRKVILADDDNTLFYELYKGNTKNGSPISAFIERTGLSMIGQNRQGEIINDIRQRKLVKRIWPKVSGGKVNVRIGSQETPEDSINWSATQEFDPNTELYLDITTNGRLIALRFESTSDEDPWELEGYDIEVEPLGEH